MLASRQRGFEIGGIFDADRQAKYAIASRTLALDPKVLVLDEPESATGNRLRRDF